MNPSDQRLLDFVGTIKHDADQVRNPYLRESEEQLSFYMNYVEQPLPPGLEWMSGELLADSFMLIESWLPSTAASVLGGRSFVVNSYDVMGERVQMALQKLLEVMRRNSEFDIRTINAMRMLGITGHAFQKNIWVTQWGERMAPVFSDPQLDAEGNPVGPRMIVDHETRRVKVYDAPLTFYPSLQEVWKSPAVDAFGKPLHWIERMPQNLDWMRQVNDDYREETGTDFYKHLDELSYGDRGGEWDTADNRGFSPKPHAAISDDTTNTSWASGLSDEQLAGSYSVMIDHNWVQVPERIKSYDDTQGRLVVTCNGKILRDVPAPSPNHRSPIRDIKLIEVANEPYGRSPLRWVIGEVEARSELRNVRLAEAWLNVMKVHVANRNANFDQNDLVTTPGAVWMYDNDQMRPQDAITELKRTPQLPDIWREDAFMEQHIDRVMGSTPHMQGEGLGSRATLGEAYLTDQRAGSRNDLMGRMVAYSAERSAMMDYLDLFRTFAEDPVRIQMDGEEGTIPVDIMAEDMDFEFSIDINADDFGLLNMQMLQALQQGLGLFWQNPETAMQLDPRKVVSEYAHRAGMGDVLRPKQEAEAILEGMAQAQQQAATAEVS